jgi:predicted dehydrogenase
MYRAAIIGCGGRAPAHIEAYHAKLRMRKIVDAEVVACCAPSPTRRDPLASRYGIKAYDNAEKMIRAEKPDIVHIVTWPDTRVELMTLVSNLGVPLCTVEKPIALGVKDWRELQRLASSTHTKFAVCHQLRWHPDVMKCQQAMMSGKLGQTLFLDISSGMNIAGQGTHTLNYGRSLVGDPLVTQVFAGVNGWDNSDPGHPAASATAAYLTFENGIRGLWTSGPVSPRCGDPGTVWQHVRIAAYAQIGRVLYEEFGKWEIAAQESLISGDYGGMEGHGKSNLLAQAGFHKAMFGWLEDDNNPPGTNLKTSLHEWAVVLALYQSALEHRPVSLDGFDPSEDLIERIKAMGAGRQASGV